MSTVPVLYSYKCPSCGRRGERRLQGDGHHGEATPCGFCGASAELEWDGGVTFAPAAPVRSVLVVDDNPDVADTLATLIALYGIEVEVRYHGAAAVEYAREHPVDLVFLDLGMPGMDGYRTAEAMRRLPSRPTIVAVSGYVASADRESTAAAGFAHHLAKPINMPELERILGRR